MCWHCIEFEIVDCTYLSSSPKSLPLCKTWNSKFSSTSLSKNFKLQTYCDPNCMKNFCILQNSQIHLPGSGIRAEVLHPRQEKTPPPTDKKHFSKISSCRVGQFTKTSKKEENPKVGFWPAVLKMELQTWPFLCSIFLSLSIFFYPLK